MSQQSSYPTTLLNGCSWEVAPPDAAPWGFCPECGGRVVLREQAPAAKGRCELHHEFWIAAARQTPPQPSDEES